MPTGMEELGDICQIIQGSGAKLHMIKSITVSQKTINLREAFVTALRRVESYPVIEVKIQLENGATGVGECVATPQIAGDSFEEIWQELNSKQIRDLTEISPALIAELELLPSSKAALDMAWWNLENMPSCSVATDVTVPIAALSELPSIVEKRVAAGFSSFKLKVEQDSISNLLRRIEIIREIAGDQVLIRIDPNQGWQLDYALRAVEELAKTGAFIEYLEQPLHKFDLPGHKALASQSAIPLMADESCFSTADLPAVIDSGAFQFVNVKVLKCGGITPAIELAQIAKAAGLQVSVGSMMEGEAGIRAAIFVAHQVAPEVVHDLDAAWWIRDGNIKYQNSRVSS